MVLLLGAVPFIGLPGAVELAFNPSNYLLAGLTVVGGVLCYRYLR